MSRITFNTSAGAHRRGPACVLVALAAGCIGIVAAFAASRRVVGRVFPRRRLALLAISAATLTAPPAHAAEFTATLSGSGNWNSSLSWSTSGAGPFPIAGDQIILGNNNNLNLTVLAGEPAVFSGGTWANSVTTQSITLNDTLTLDSGTFAYRPTTATGNYSIRGTNTSFINQAQGTFLIGGTASPLLLTATSGSLTFQNEGQLVFENANALRLSSTASRLENSGTISAFNSAAAAAFAASITTGTTNTLVRNTNTGLVIADGAFARLTIQTPFTDEGGRIEAANGGVLTLSSTWAGGLSTAATTAFTASSGTVNIRGRINQLQGTITGTNVFLGNSPVTTEGIRTMSSGTSFIDFGSTEVLWSGTVALAANSAATSAAFSTSSTDAPLELRSPVRYVFTAGQAIYPAGGALVNKSTFTLDSPVTAAQFADRLVDSRTKLLAIALYGGTSGFVNSGTFTMLRGSVLMAESNSTFRNSAGSLIEAVAGTTARTEFNLSSASDTNVWLYNSGTIRANGKDLAIGVPIANTNGTLEASNGGVLQLANASNTPYSLSNNDTTLIATSGTIRLSGRIDQIVFDNLSPDSKVELGASLARDNGGTFLFTGLRTVGGGTSVINFGGTEVLWTGTVSNAGTSNAYAFSTSGTDGPLELRSPVRFVPTANQGIIPGAGALVNKSTFTLDSPLAFSNNFSSLNIGGAMQLLGGTSGFVNSGTFTMLRGDVIFRANNATFRNPAGSLIESVAGETAGTSFRQVDDVTNARLFNSGTIRANGKDLTVAVVLVDTGGVLRAENGGTLRLLDPANRFDSKNADSGGLTTSGSTLFSTSATGTIALGGFIDQVSGTVDPGSNITLGVTGLTAGARPMTTGTSFIDLLGTTIRWVGGGVNVGGAALEFRSPVSYAGTTSGAITGPGTLRIASTGSFAFESGNGLFLVPTAGAVVENAGLFVTDNASATGVFQAMSGTIANSGTIRATAAATQTLIGSGTARLSNPGTLEVVAANAGGVTLRTGSTATLTFADFSSGTLTGGTYRVTATGASAATLDLNAVGGSGVITKIGANATVVISQSSSGAAAFTQLGAIDEVDGGVYLYGNASQAFASGASQATVSGTLAGSGLFSGRFTLNPTGQIALDPGGRLQLAGDLTGSGLVSMNGGSIVAAANLSIPHALSLPGTGTFDTAGFGLDVTGGMNGAGGLVKTGAGWLRLSGSSIGYSGGSTVSAGGLIFASRASQPAGTTTVASGATLGLGVSSSDAALFDAAAVDSLFAGTFAGVSNTTGVSSVGLDTSAGDFTYASNISGPRGIVKYGANVLTLSGASTFSGGTEIVAGGILLANPSALGTGTATLSGGTLDLGNQSIANAVVMTGGTLASGTIGISQVTVPAGAGRISAGLSGAGGFTKTGTGTLFLAGNNTYSGTTAITAGTLVVERNTGSLPSTGAVTLSSTAGLAGLVIDNVGATGALSQSVGLLGFEAGAATVSLVRTAAQDLSLTSSSLSVAAGATGNLVPGGGTNSAANGFAITGQAAGFLNARLYYDGSSFAWYDSTGFVRGINYGSDADTESSAGGTSVSGSTHLQLTGNVTAQTTRTFTTLAFTGAPTAYTLGGSQQVTVTGLLKSGTGTTTMSGGNGIRAPSNTDLAIRTDLTSGTLAINHVIAANGVNGLTKSGAGTLSLNAVNTFNGLTRPLEGTLVVAGASALQTSTLEMGPAGDGTVLFNQNSTLGGLAGSRDLSFGNRLITVGNNGGSTAYSGILSSGTLTKLGTGTLNLGNAATTGILRYTGSGDTTDRALNLAGTTGGATLDASGSGALVFDSAFTATGAGNKTLTLTGTSTAMNSIVSVPNSSGTTSVTKTGPGLWRLSGASNYTGRLTVLDGTIVAAAGVNQTGSGVFGGGTNVDQIPLVGDSAADATGQAAVLLESDVLIDRGLVIAGLGTGATQEAILGMASPFGTGTFGGGGSIRLGRDLTLQAADGGTVRFANAWQDTSGGGSPAVAFNIGSAGNTGTVVFGSFIPDAITAVNVRRGTLRLAAGDETIGYATPVTIGETGFAGTLDLNGINQPLASLSFAGVDSTVTGPGTLRLFNNGSTATVNVAGIGHTIATALALDDAASFTVAAGGRLGISSVIADGLTAGEGLTKSGLGILELSGSNSYTGITNVNAGGLLVSGTNMGTGLVSVLADGWIGGRGRLTGDLALSGSTARLVFDPAGALNVLGSVTIDSLFGVSSLVSVNGLGIDWSSIADGTYTLLATESTFDNIKNFGPTKAHDIGGGRSAYFQNGSLQLVIVPEPGAMALAALGIAAAAAYAARRRVHCRHDDGVRVAGCAGKAGRAIGGLGVAARASGDGRSRGPRDR